VSNRGALSSAKQVQVKALLEQVERVARRRTTSSPWRHRAGPRRHVERAQTRKGLVTDGNRDKDESFGLQPVEAFRH